eukprot:1197754-Amphidinium_carterae.1
MEVMPAMGAGRLHAAIMTKTTVPPFGIAIQLDLENQHSHLTRYLKSKQCEEQQNRNFYSVGGHFKTLQKNLAHGPCEEGRIAAIKQHMS